MLSGILLDWCRICQKGMPDWSGYQGMLYAYMAMVTWDTSTMLARPELST